MKRNKNQRSTRTDLVLDLFAAVLVATVCAAIFIHEFNLWSK